MIHNVMLLQMLMIVLQQKTAVVSVARIPVTGQVLVKKLWKNVNEMANNNLPNGFMHTKVYYTG
jgi:hypothetical protein